MASYTTEDIRNVALVGHAGSGKTTLTEALLFEGGALTNKGSVEKGTTMSDHDPLEHKHQHSINSSVVSLDYQNSHINIVDTPGYVDFLGPTISALAAVETVAVVVDAHAGIDAIASQLMKIALDTHRCRMILINKIDAEDINLPALLATIQERFGKECLPINLPANGGTEVVDCFFNPSGDADFSSVEEAHTALVDQVVEVDDKLMELYLEQGEINPDQLHDPFEKALRDGHIIPVCFVSANTGAGIKEMLDISAKLLPNPIEGNLMEFVKNGGGEDENLEIKPNGSGHVLAHVFKVDFDPFVGKLGKFRVHQGLVKKDTQLFADDNRKAIKIGHLFKPQGKQMVEVEEAIPGDICVLAKVDELHWDTILHDSHDEDDVHLKPRWFPAPMTGLAIDAKRRGDEQKISDALNKLAEEDPCLTIERDASSNETVLRGLGDLHLRVALEKMSEHFHVEVSTHTPSIPYRETITKPAEGHHRHKKQSGGSGQFGEVFLKIEPLKRGQGFEFVNAISGGVIPNQFVPGVEKGVRQVIEEGAIAGYPVQDVKVTVYDGKYHAVDSNEVSFVMAGRKAFASAVTKAKPIILEPIVDMAITAPEAAMGDLTGDISSRRGRIKQTDSQGGGMILLSTQAPLAELDDYLSRLKSMTGGEGSYAMQFSHYDPVPHNVQEQIIAERKKTAEEG